MKEEREGGQWPRPECPLRGGGGRPACAPGLRKGGPPSPPGGSWMGGGCAPPAGSLAGASGTLCHALDVCRLALSPGQVAWALHGSSQPLFKENSTCLLKARYFPQIQL